MPPKSPNKHTRLDHLEQAIVDNNIAADGTEYQPEDLSDLVLTKRIKKANNRIAAITRKIEQGDAYEEQVSDSGPIEFLSTWERIIQSINEQYRVEQSTMHP